jgi:hypothetical protein
MLLCLKQLTLEPDTVSAKDVRRLLDLGLSRDHVRDAMYVAYLFNTYARLADTLNWHVPGPDAFQAGARRLLKHGYL